MPGITKDDRLLELQRQRNLLRAPEFRTSVQSHRDILSAIVPLLNFNDVYYSNAFPIADVLSRPNFSSRAYDQAYAQIDSIVSQAIAELEHGITPTPPSRGLVSTPNQRMSTGSCGSGIIAHGVCDGRLLRRRRLEPQSSSSQAFALAVLIFLLRSGSFGNGRRPPSVTCGK